MVKQQMEVQMLTTMYGEVVKNLELSKTMAAIEEPLIQVIDVPRYPLERITASKTKGLILGGIIGGMVMLGWVLVWRGISTYTTVKN